MPILMALCSAIMLWVGWPVSPLTFLLFFAFVPLLLVEDQSKKLIRFFGIVWLTMFLWNLATTWWIWNSTPEGAIGAIVSNSLLMCIPWIGFYKIKRRFGTTTGYIALVVYWLSFEYLHQAWELSWPWLTLGNAMAVQPNMVQWYEYTGTSGGSLWILVVNILTFQLFRQQPGGAAGQQYRLPALLAAAMALPVVISLLIKPAPAMANASKNIVVVQPNIDPYSEKFAAGTQEAQIQKLIRLSEQNLDTNTSLIVWPETAIPVGVWEEEIRENFFYKPIWAFLARHPKLSLLSGIDSYHAYGKNKDSATITSRYNKEDGIYYDAYNTAAMLDSAPPRIQLYHKSKLVPGVETLPSWLGFMNKIFEDFGGIGGTLGRQKTRAVFTDINGFYKAAPIICYESIYGEYVTEYVRRGANVLTIVTNDGWWGNTPGYKQHMNYGRLRAIETRCWVARSANTGISCFIDPTGKVWEPQPWDKEAVIKMSIPLQPQQTFYVRYRDILSKAAFILTCLLVLWAFTDWIRKLTNRRA